MNINKKGAMFGLDARIALAIFGALSVISGAALYSAIQESKVVAIITEFNELEKAITQYILDVGQNIPPVSSGSDTLEIHDLIKNESSATGWKGPYMSYGELSAVLDHPTYTSVTMYKYTNGTWGTRSCVGTIDCYYSVAITHIDKSIANAIETRIDGAGNENAAEGKIRIVTSGVSGKPDLRNVYMITDINYK
jgi:type II secretory pathway pseudopilin PulG